MWKEKSLKISGKKKDNEKGARQRRGREPPTVHTHICPHTRSPRNLNPPGEAEPRRHSLHLSHQLNKAEFLKGRPGDHQYQDQWETDQNAES